MKVEEIKAILEHPDLPAENRARDFFSCTSSRTRTTWSQPDRPHPETVSTTTTTAPGLFSFLSKDPIGISGGLNQYAFCDNNPVNYRDPTGLLSIDVAIIIFKQYMRDNPDFARRVRASWKGKGDEVGWFFVNDPEKGPTIVPWPEDPNNEPTKVYGPPEAPPNSMGEGHTHQSPRGDPNGPSGADYSGGYGLDGFVFDPNWAWRYIPGRKPYVPMDRKKHSCD